MKAIITTKDGTLIQAIEGRHCDLFRDTVLSVLEKLMTENTDPHEPLTSLNVVVDYEV